MLTATTSQSGHQKVIPTL